MKPHGNAHFCLLKNRKMEEQCVDLQLQEQRVDLQLQKWGLILTNDDNDEPSNDNNVEPSEVAEVDLADFGVGALLSEEEESDEVGFFDDDMPGVEGHPSEQPETAKKSKAFKHHRGPVSIEYQVNKTARQKTFSKRKDTLLKSAKELHKMTGASVHLIIVSETKRIFKYESKVVHRRNVWTQYGSPTLPPPPPMLTRSSINHTPKKVTPKRKESSSTLVSPLNVSNLPGKKEIENTPAESAKSTKKVTGKCKVYSIIFESKANKAFCKTNGIRKTTWIGCDIPNCKFWAHASCAGLLIQPKKPVKSHKFLCSDHRRS